MVDSKRLEPGAITEAILWIRGLRVILDDTLASLYGVPTKSLIRVVKRNNARFPPHFMFPLTAEEFDILRYQSGTSSSNGGPSP